MHTCQACQRQFNNQQSLYAHYKHCKKYKEAKAKKKAPGSSSGQPDLRGPPGADSMDPLKNLYAQFGLTPPQDSTASPSPQARRRTLLQQVKCQVIDWYVTSEGRVNSTMRGEAWKVIDVELSKEPLEEFSWTEIHERAMAIRDTVYAPYFRQEREERERQAMQKRERLEQAIRDQRTAEQRELQKTLRLEFARLRVTAECERRGISGSGKWSVDLAIEQRLQGTLSGGEPETEAAEIIQLIIDQHFHAYDELGSARAERKRQQLFDQVGDVAIGLTPLALALAKPAIEKGFNWVVEKCGLGNPPTPEASSPESPGQDEHTGR